MLGDGVVIVDEASMVPTLVLDEMVRAAGVYGSKITLIGDFAQMGAPEAGGLLRDQGLPSAVELTSVRRFQQSWEADVSLQLRARTAGVAATYAARASWSRVPTGCSTTPPRLVGGHGAGSSLPGRRWTQPVTPRTSAPAATPFDDRRTTR